VVDADQSFCLIGNELDETEVVQAGLKPTEGAGPAKVFIHFTMSLDGFIADVGGRLDWAFGFSGPSPAAVRKITNAIGAVLAGRHGYDLGMMRGDMKVYGGAWSGPQFVLPHRPGDAPADPSITFLSCGIAEAVSTARAAAIARSIARAVRGASGIVTTFPP
jgi:dihydrofolate reductase